MWKFPHETRVHTLLFIILIKGGGPWITPFRTPPPPPPSRILRGGRRTPSSVSSPIPPSTSAFPKVRRGRKQVTSGTEQSERKPCFLPARTSNYFEHKCEARAKFASSHHVHPAMCCFTRVAVHEAPSDNALSLGGSRWITCRITSKTEARTRFWLVDHARITSGSRPEALSLSGSRWIACRITSKTEAKTLFWHMDHAWITSLVWEFPHETRVHTLFVTRVFIRHV